MKEITKHKKPVNGAPAIASQKLTFLCSPPKTLGPEIREEISNNLEPPHAGREVFVPYYFRGSHLYVLQKCCPIYLEAFPIFLLPLNPITQPISYYSDSMVQTPLSSRPSERRSREFGCQGSIIHAPSYQMSPNNV